MQANLAHNLFLFLFLWGTATLLKMADGCFIGYMVYIFIMSYQAVFLYPS